MPIGLVAFIEAVIERVGSDGYGFISITSRRTRAFPIASMSWLGCGRRIPVILGLKDSSGDLEYSAALTRRLRADGMLA